MRLGGQRHAATALHPGKTVGSYLQEAGWAPGPVSKGAENSIPGPSSNSNPCCFLIRFSNITCSTRRDPVSDLVQTMFRKPLALEEKSLVAEEL